MTSTHTEAPSLGLISPDDQAMFLARFAGDRLSLFPDPEDDRTILVLVHRGRFARRAAFIYDARGRGAKRPKWTVGRLSETAIRHEDWGMEEDWYTAR